MTYTVTQEDRDAAAAYYRERYPRDVTLPPIMVAGQADSGLTIQAFARHRIETLERAAEVAVAAAEETIMDARNSEIETDLRAIAVVLSERIAAAI